MINLVYSLFSMTIAGSVVFILLKALEGFTRSHFSASWHYRMTKVTTMFFIIPIAKLCSSLSSIFPIMHIQTDNIMEPVICLNPTQMFNRSRGNQLQTHDSVNIYRYLFIIWLIGSLTFLLFQLVSYLKFREVIADSEELKNRQLSITMTKHKEHLKIKRDIKLCRSTNITTPMLVGLIKPVILFPADIDFEKHSQYIIQHELIHFKRKDLWIKLVAMFTNALHWFNPLVYLLFRDMDKWCEYSCDEEITRKLSHAKRKDYAMAILNAITPRKKHPNVIKKPFSTPFSTSKSKLERRLSFMLKFKDTNRICKVIPLLIAVAILCCGSIVAYATGNEQEGSPKPSDVNVLPEMDTPDTPEEDPSILETPIDLSNTNERDIAGGPEITPQYANISETRTLSKGKSKTYRFNMDGSFGKPSHNAVSVVINKNSGGNYQYISENVTTKTTLANVTYSGSAKRTLTNLKSDHTYEITIINLGTSDLKYSISITSYIE